jgi:hypothetical protein
VWLYTRVAQKVMPHFFFLGNYLFRMYEIHARYERGIALLKVKAGRTDLLLPYFKTLKLALPIPVAARSKTWVFGRSLAGIVCSNPAGGMVICLLRVLLVVR